jgi:hypothetical protein
MDLLYFEHDILLEFITIIKIEKKPFQKEVADVDFIDGEQTITGFYYENVEALYFSSKIMYDYFRYAEDLGKNLFREISENFIFEPDPQVINLYIDKLINDYFGVYRTIVYDKNSKIKLNVFETTKDIIATGESIGFEETLSNFFKSLQEFLRKLIKDLQDLKAEKNVPSKSVSLNAVDKEKLVWHGQVKQLVDIFYRLKNELKNKEDKFYLEGADDKLIAQVIMNSFLTKDDKSFSFESIKTSLKESRQEKRPNQEDQIDINTSLS